MVERPRLLEATTSESTGDKENDTPMQGIISLKILIFVLVTYFQLRWPDDCTEHREQKEGWAEYANCLPVPVQQQHSPADGSVRRSSLSVVFFELRHSLCLTEALEAESSSLWFHICCE